MSTLDKVILFIGKTFVGHIHDYTMLKEEFPPEEAWFEFFQVLVDLGYQGILTDYVGENIQMPHCVNIEWDTSHSEISVESEGEEENDGTKSSRQTQPKWNHPQSSTRSRGAA